MKTDCFGNVLKAAPDLSDAVVVHGTVIQLTTGKRIDHAWVEIPGMVIDPTARFTCPRADYYELVGAQADACYDPMDALVNAIRSGHKGPWRPDERFKPPCPAPQVVK